MLTRIIFKASLSVLIILAATGYGSYLTTGQLPFGLEGLSVKKVTTPLQNQFSSLKNQVENITGSEKNSSESGIYKWQDQQGEWHYGDAPPNTASATPMHINLQQNVINAVTAKKPQHEEKPTETSQAEEPSSGSAYSPSTVKKLFNDAQGLQEKLNGRFAQQQELLKPQ
ncbi:MAG: DUF4124 domain-containing protein [Gammaproteobacteria bacterium]|nr:DUF4124 domain-containing protein [Gammaproteobacteria bacterium]